MQPIPSPYLFAQQVRVKSSSKVGSETIYPLYSPGVLYQLLTTEEGLCDASGAGYTGILTTPNPKDRFKKIYLKSNMADDHHLTKMLPCLQKFAT